MAAETTLSYPSYISKGRKACAVCCSEGEMNEHLRGHTKSCARQTAPSVRGVLCAHSGNPRSPRSRASELMLVALVSRAYSDGGSVAKASSGSFV